MGEPVWELAMMFPTQGNWTEEDYLALPDRYPHVELVDGSLEVLPTPTDDHQRILQALVLLFGAYARATGGVSRPAGIRIRLREGLFREPDLVFLAATNLHHRRNRFWTGADLVVEIVSASPADRVRDQVAKRRDYAAAGVREYWFVDPDAETITVLGLEGDRYAERGVYARGQTARSAAFEGLSADVSAVMDAP